MPEAIDLSTPHQLMIEEGWLQTRKLSKHFGAVVALHDINLRIGLGEVVALVGDKIELTVARWCR